MRLESATLTCLVALVLSPGVAMATSSSSVSTTIPMDTLYIGLAIAFFAASCWFVRACASLEPGQEEKK